MYEIERGMGRGTGNGYGMQQGASITNKQDGLLRMVRKGRYTRTNTQTVQLVRGFEKRTVDAWKAAGARPPPHALVPTREALAALQNT